MLFIRCGGGVRICDCIQTGDHTGTTLQGPAAAAQDKSTLQRSDSLVVVGSTHQLMWNTMLTILRDFFLYTNYDKKGLYTTFCLGCYGKLKRPDLSKEIRGYIYLVRQKGDFFSYLTS